MAIGSGLRHGSGLVKIGKVGVRRDAHGGMTLAGEKQPVDGTLSNIPRCSGRSGPASIDQPSAITSVYSPTVA